MQVYTCGHAYCEECSERILRESAAPVCPMCRARVSRAQVFRVAVAAPAGGGAADSAHAQEVDPPEGRGILAMQARAAPRRVVCGWGVEGCCAGSLLGM